MQDRDLLHRLSTLQLSRAPAALLWLVLVVWLCACGAAQRSDDVATAAQRPVATATPSGSASSQPAAPSPVSTAAAPAPVDAGPPTESGDTAPVGGLTVATRVGEISEFVSGSPDSVLRQAFQCALSGDFSCYAALNVRSNRDTDIALAHLRNYQWKVFRERAASYIVAAQPFTVRVTRRDNEGGSGAAPRRHKLFLFSKARDNPAPITFQVEDGVWRIYVNSL